LASSPSAFPTSTATTGPAIASVPVRTGVTPAAGRAVTPTPVRP
jgi:hypothetical protein